MLSIKFNLFTGNRHHFVSLTFEKEGSAHDLGGLCAAR